MAIWRFFKTSIIGGLVILLPVGIGAYFLSLGVEVIAKAAGPLLHRIGLDTAAGYFFTALILITALVLLCFVLGILVRTGLGRWFGGWIEALALNHLPGYTFFKRVSQQVMGKGDGSLGVPVVVELNGARQLGFQIEQLADGTRTVFVPLAPVLTHGNIYLVRAEQVTRLSASLSEALNCIGQLGFGAGKLLTPLRTET